jgi:hypothetical protein
VVGLERVEHGVERGGHLRDVGQLVRRQLVEVLVDRGRRLDLVADAVEAGHEHRRERQVGVARRVGAAELEALGLGVVAGDRDADAGRAVALAVDQVDRRLEARHQAVVAVDRRVGEGQQRRRVVQQAADVVARGVRQPGVADLVVEQRRAVLPQRLVAVHAGAVVADDGLGHEGRGLAVLVRGVLDDVLEHHHVVRALEQGVELVVDLLLPGRADLVVAALDGHAGVLQLDGDLVAQVGVVVGGGDREVAALGAGL